MSKEVKEDQTPVAVSKSMVMEGIENGCGTVLDIVESYATAQF